ncbi:phage capsid protein [Agrobacterium tumefaciens]|uniref:phage capsid protein n=1 Tax=Agrobacterium tumefaciens TaxID=358 RepID=UPI001574976C|nr:phage capsid protein [Agrobacterium tumefaciens]WCK01031.1 phage capsid protein [Agrobacterium tumefaciens]
MPVSNWFREEIKGLVRARYQAKGGYLDGTTLPGESSAGTVKYPVGGGRIEMYELTGSINKISPSAVNLDMVTLITKDYEASVYFRMQDEKRMGPSLKAKLADDLTKSQRRKKDRIKLDALNDFANAGASLSDTPNAIQTIGDGTARVDLLNAIDAIDQIAGAGSDDEVFWPIPNVWMSQLLMYKEFSNADYMGPSDLPFAKASKVMRKTFRGVHMFTMPDEYFTYGSGGYVPGTPGFTGVGYLDTFMWTKDALGSETWWDQENMTIDPLPDYEGTPHVCKVQLSSASIGILPEGIKRVRNLAIKNAVRI